MESLPAHRAVARGWPMRGRGGPWRTRPPPHPPCPTQSRGSYARAPDLEIRATRAASGRRSPPFGPHRGPVPTLPVLTRGESNEHANRIAHRAGRHLPFRAGAASAGAGPDRQAGGGRYAHDRRLHRRHDVHEPRAVRRLRAGAGRGVRGPTREPALDRPAVHRRGRPEHSAASRFQWRAGAEGVGAEGGARGGLLRRSGCAPVRRRAAAPADPARLRRPHERTHHRAVRTVLVALLRRGAGVGDAHRLPARLRRGRHGGLAVPGDLPLPRSQPRKVDPDPAPARGFRRLGTGGQRLGCRHRHRQR